MFKGVMDYRMGTARAGDYGYEPLGVYHENTSFIEDTELFFTNYGPIAFLNEDKSVKFLLDWKFSQISKPPLKSETGKRPRFPTLAPAERALGRRPFASVIRTASRRGLSPRLLIVLERLVGASPWLPS